MGQFSLRTRLGISDAGSLRGEHAHRAKVPDKYIVSLEIYSYCADVCCDYFYFNNIFSLLFFPSFPPFLFFLQPNRGREGFLAD